MTDIDYTHNPYGKLAAEEQAIKDALDIPQVLVTANELVVWAHDALAKAGFDGRKVRVQLWVSDPEGCGLTIVSPS